MDSVPKNPHTYAGILSFFRCREIYHFTAAQPLQQRRRQQALAVSTAADRSALLF